ncbi:MAG: hypothetical protein APR54_00930 [Candidatus Cloacimonas sp. SDB]|nr:MAG: hypothetical protein APR54_00930 [Candidatus Cloacimonas sp. SDB]
MSLKKSVFLVSLLVITLTLFLSSCDKRTAELPQYKIVSISANPEVIYADNNITYSEISVLVKDDDNFAITGENVTFRSNIGHILKNIPTDSMGVATTTFWDSGDIGTATIEAFIYDVKAEVEVEIQAVPEIESLVFTQIPLELNIDDLATIKARATNTAGIVTDGTVIIFETELGFFVNSEGVEIGGVASATTSNGVARVNLNAGDQQGKTTITARIGHVFVEQDITIHPGTPRYLYLFPEAYEIEANSNQNIQIIAQVEDKYHNPVTSGVGVTFQTTLGNVGAYAATDTNGIAVTYFSPGVTAGTAQIDAVADSATASTFITVTSDQVSSIVFDFQGVVGIQVQGTGGQESFELSVSLKDMSGNLVNENKVVYFELLDYPLGTNINNVGYADSTTSSNGHAIVSINSGTESGIVRVRAYTYNNSGTLISAEKSNIVVNAGPPNSTELTIGGHDEGVNIGAGAWRVEVAALVTDLYGNPVGSGTAVFFSLLDEPGFASIEAAAFVGNENANGDSLQGTAYTYLTYDGAFTNELIQISLNVGGVGGFLHEVILPIQFPVIDMVAVPMHLDWNTLNDNQPKESEIRITVKDGQNNAINNQIVTFSSTLGTPLAPYPPDTGDPYTGLTHVIDGEGGRLDKDVQFQKIECPAPTPAGPGTTTATVTAQILGTQTNNSVTIILFRYVD